MNVLVCFQHNFVMPCGVMLYSLLANNIHWPLNIYAIVDKDVTESDKNDIITIVSSFEQCVLTFYEISHALAEMFPRARNKRFDRSVYYRLLAASLLPAEVERVIYLDCDTIIRGDLGSLWSYDLDGIGIAGVINQSQREDYFNRLGLSRQRRYLNSGVLILNLAYWRVQNKEDELLAYIQSYSEILKNPDQDVLNVIFGDSHRELPLKYNAQSVFFYKTQYLEDSLSVYTDEIKRLPADAAILHFTGWDKPWMKPCYHPLRAEFLKYKNGTQWKDEELFSFPLLYRVKRLAKILLSKLSIYNYVDISELYK